MKSSNGSLKLTLLFVSSLTIMSMVTISPSLPEMSKAFSDIPNAEFLVKMVLTLPGLFIAIISPIAGALIDKYGRLKLLWAALILYAAAGTSGYLIDNLYQLLFSRALLGIAVGISMTIVVTLVADYFEGAERQKFAGIQIAFMSIGGIVFIGLGGVLADINWRLPFLIYGFALLIFPLTILFLKEPQITSQQNQSSNTKLKSPKIIWLLFVNVMIMWILFFLIPVQIPFHLKAIGVEKNSLIGAAIAISTTFSAISAILYSKIKDRFSFFTIYAVGYFIMAIAFALVAMADTYMMVIVGMMVGGFGMGMMIPNTNLWVMKLAPAEIRGKEIGRLTTFWFMGQFLSPLLLLPVANIFTIPQTFYMAAVTLLVISLGFTALKLGLLGLSDK